MPNPYKLPSYRHVQVDGVMVRAYLVLAADVHGHWSGSYHAWVGENEEGTGQYYIVPPVVQGQPDIRTTCRRLERILRETDD